MKCLWTIICQNSITDSNTNALSLLNILEEVSVVYTKVNEKDEKIPIAFDLVFLFYDEKNNLEKNIDLILQIFDSENKKIDENKVGFVWEKNKKRMRLNVRVNGLPIKDSGTYYFCAKYKKQNEKNYKVTEKTPLDISIQTVLKTKKKC